MLHGIKPVSCSPALDWIVRLQRDILVTLCDPKTTSATVTAVWIAGIQPVVGQWLAKFCSRSYDRETLIARMRRIANLDPVQKSIILRYFDNNQEFSRAFVAGDNPAPTTSINIMDNRDIERCLGKFLEAFYEIAFRKGLPVDRQGNTGGSFTRKGFLQVFAAENGARVCPLCDGEMDGPEIDHWLSKKFFPALSCHPRNLVPVCHRCNSRECKGEQVAMTLGNNRPFDDWYHPYERPASGHFTIEVHGNGIRLLARDRIQATRITNLDRLVKLTERWSQEYKHQTNDFLRKLRIQVRRMRTSLTEERLQQKIMEWIDEVEAVMGHAPHSLVGRAVLEYLNDPASPQFRAWLEHANEALL